MRAILLLTLFVWSTAGVAGIHRYIVPRIAETEAKCDEVESWLVSRFAKLADADVLSHGCELNPFRTFDIVIEYTRPIAANLVTTYDDYDYVNALYDSAEDCVAHYDEDKAAFKEATGIEPLIAYCIHDRKDSEVDNGWMMRIDGFGKPKMTPQHLARDFYNGIHGDVAALQTHLKSTLESYGAKHTKVKIEATDNRSIVHAMYYAERILPIAQYSEGQFKSIEACENYREELREIFARADGQSAIFFCGGTTMTPTVYIYTAGVVMQPLATDLTSVKYSTTEACEAKRRETENAWREGLQKNVVGSVCAYDAGVLDDGNVRMRMFWLD